jgi:hypothetical protein
MRLAVEVSTCSADRTSIGYRLLVESGAELALFPRLPLVAARGRSMR